MVESGNFQVESVTDIYVLCSVLEFIMPWIIVKFIDTNEVEAVPEKWYDGTTRLLFYPPFSSKEVEKAIKHEYSPDPKDWTLYRVELLSRRTFPTFPLACAKATKACHTSDISDVEHLSLKRIPKKKVISSSDSESSEGSLKNWPSQPQQKRLSLTQGKVEPAKSNKSKHSEEDVEQNIIKPIVTPEEGSDDSKLHRLLLKMLVQQKKILFDHDKALECINEKLDNLSSVVEQALKISKKDMEGSQETTSVLKKLPIKNLEEFTIIEELLSEKKNFNDMVDNLSLLGGASYKECSRRFMKKLMDDSVTKLFSLHGHKGKQVFANTSCFLAVTAAIHKSIKNITTKEIELAIGQWLAKANERLKKQDTDGLRAHPVGSAEVCSE